MNLKKIPLTEQDITVIKDKKLVVIAQKKFEALIRYIEDLENKLAFAEFEQWEEKKERDALNALSQSVYQMLKQSCTIPERIQIILNAQNISIQKLSKITGLPYTTTHRIVRGVSQGVTAETLVKIAQALKFPATILIRGVKPI